jgi:hypothetical protein
MMKNKLKNSGIGCLIIASTLISNNTLSAEYGWEEVSIITANEYLRGKSDYQRLEKFLIDRISDYYDNNRTLGVFDVVPSLNAVRNTYGKLGSLACLNSGAKNVDSSTAILGVKNHSSSLTNNYVISEGTPYKVKSKHHGGLSPILYKYYYSFRVDEKKLYSPNYTSTLIDNGHDENEIVYTFTQGTVDINATVFSDEGSGWYIGVKNSTGGGDLNHELDVSFSKIKFGGDLYELWECGSTNATVEKNTAPNIDNANIDINFVSKPSRPSGDRKKYVPHYNLSVSGITDKHTVDGNLSYSWSVDGVIKSYGLYLSLPDTTPEPTSWWGKKTYWPNTTVRNVKLIVSDGHLSKIINVDGSSTFNTTTNYK